MQIKNLHVEASTYCNARCPLCPRSLYGYKVEGVYPEVHLSLSKLSDCLSKFPDIESITFNGNLGDPMMNPNILSLATSKKCFTNITTNGSIGNKETWTGLAKNNVQVTFSIDGLADTNHLYRQDVEWQKVIDRINWFVRGGGQAIWKFVIFKHNAHQIEEARKLSNTLGFKNFQVEDHGRNYGPALDKNGKITHWILPADGSLSPSNYDVPAGVKRYKQSHHNFFSEEKIYQIKCGHKEFKSIYIDAHGRIGPCCYQGFDLPGLPFQTLEDFESIERTWNTKKCNWVCAMTCGKLE